MSICEKVPNRNHPEVFDYFVNGERVFGDTYEKVRVLEESDRMLRRSWWLDHGCSPSGQYGDDGEMQCSGCMTDFKREPIDKLHSIWFAYRVKLAQDKGMEI